MFVFMRWIIGYKHKDELQVFLSVIVYKLEGFALESRLRYCTHVPAQKVIHVACSVSKSTLQSLTTHSSLSFSLSLSHSILSLSPPGQPDSHTHMQYTLFLWHKVLLPLKLNHNFCRVFKENKYLTQRPPYYTLTIILESNRMTRVFKDDLAEKSPIPGDVGRKLQLLVKLNWVIVWYFKCSADLLSWFASLVIIFNCGRVTICGGERESELWISLLLCVVTYCLSSHCHICR